MATTLMDILQAATNRVDVSVTSWESHWEQEKKKRDEQPLDLPEDPLALSWASYRKWKDQGIRWADLATVEATVQDREDAAITRRYFTDAIMMRMLRGERLTTFQTDCYAMLTTVARQKHVGMLMKLPYFYVEDQARRAVLQELRQPDPAQLDPQWQKCKYRGQLSLLPRRQISRCRRPQESMEYWWADAYDYAVNWTVATNNPLQSLVHGLYQSAKPVVIDCTMTWRRWQGMFYRVPQEIQLIW